PLDHIIISCVAGCYYVRSFPTRRSSDLRRADAAGVVVMQELGLVGRHVHIDRTVTAASLAGQAQVECVADLVRAPAVGDQLAVQDRKSTRLNSSHVKISYAVFCLKIKSK